MRCVCGPDRIVVGEVRGEEALDMLQAMNTGHDGSLTTIHANSPRDGLYRLDTMIAMANLNIPDRAVRQQIASAVNLIVQVNRIADGTRKITSIAEITGMEQDVITMQELFTFTKSGVDRDGHVTGTFRATGIRPKCAERLAAAGVPAADGHVRARASGGRRRPAEAPMIPVVTFALVFIGCSGAYWFFVVRPEQHAERALSRRLTPRGRAAVTATGRPAQGRPGNEHGRRAR
jgi:hypothetical protein